MTARRRSLGSTGAWLRLAAAALVFVVLVSRLGAGPFLDGLRLTSAWSLLAAAGITGATTACCAWRWRLVADALGVRLGGRAAVAAVYRAQFLNATLPGGVLGDVDRAVDQARDSGPVGPGLRSVVWERMLGQVVQAASTLAAVLLLPSPLHGVGVVAAAVALVAATSLLTVSCVAGRARVVRRLVTDLRLLATSGTVLTVALLSAAAVAGHALVFLLAARRSGVDAPMTVLVPLAAVVLLAAAVPANIAGWGPREGVAAWAFGAAGLGAAAGVTTAVVYGVMALVATLPGALVVMAGRRGTSRVALDHALAREEVVCG